MDHLHATHERSLERSYLRLRVLLMMASLGEAFPRQLAKACEIDVSRLNQILFGDGGDYSMELALIELGLVEVAATPLGRLYRISSAGRRKARRLAARARRREDFRRANRDARDARMHPSGRELGSPRAYPRAECRDTEPVGTPVEALPLPLVEESLRWPAEE